MEELNSKHVFRIASASDLDLLYDAEKRCFKGDYLNREDLEAMLERFPEHFLLLYKDGVFLGYQISCPSSLEHFEDTLFQGKAYEEEGSQLYLLGLGVLPEHQGKGYGRILIERLKEEALRQKRKKIILTCKEDLVPFYSRYGFKLTGDSLSCFAGKRWKEMALVLSND